LRTLGIWLSLAAFAAGRVYAQAASPAPTPLTLLQQEAEKRTVEWATLASGLEARLVRLLPCDPKVRGSIDEVNRASEARIAAANGYWQAVAAKSASQLDEVRKLKASEEARAAEWGQNRAGADAEITAMQEEATALTASARQLPALSGSQRTLDVLTQLSKQSATQAQAREAAGIRLNEEVQGLLTAAEKRQSSLDAQLKSLAAEANSWRSYYAARIVRAQTECTITDPAAANAAAAAAGTSPAKPRPANRKKKQP
jgi:hypothetical protein